jgi:hypothetical protein
MMRRNYFFLLGFIGLMLGLPTLIINIVRLVAILIFVSDILGFITYYIAFRVRFRNPSGVDPI